MFLCAILTGLWLWAGCASRTSVSSAEPNVSSAPARMLYEDGVTTAEVIRAAEEVLTQMQFPIEKLDTEQGIIRTKPLRGAQFFEVWRSDNASSLGCEQSNLQSIRRSVELRVKREAVDRRPQAQDAYSLQPAASSLLCIECDVSAQRLSLPENEIAGTSEAYRIHSRSAPTEQRLELSLQQRRAMTWIDLGKDPDLAARILNRIAKRLKHVD
jgi:hypothetical protein